MSPASQFDMHPGTESLNGFVEQILSPAERQSVLSHMADCARCREVVYLALEAAEGLAVVAPETAIFSGYARDEGGWFRTWRFAWPLGAALAAAITLMVAVGLRHPAKQAETANAVPQREAVAQPAVSPEPANNVAAHGGVHSAPARESAPRGAAPVGNAVDARSTGSMGDMHVPERGMAVHRSLNGNRAVSANGAPAIGSTEAGSSPSAHSAGLGSFHFGGFAHQGPSSNGHIHAAAPHIQVIAPPTHSSAPQVTAGETVEQVIADFGQPTKRAIIDDKTLYFYPDMKITFMNGKTSEIQSLVAGLPSEGGAAGGTGAVTLVRPLGSAAHGTSANSAGRRRGLPKADPLPSGLPRAGEVYYHDRWLVVDSNGGVFLSFNDENWIPVARQWTGRASGVRLVDVTSVDASIASQDRAGMAFELVNDAGSIWISSDGRIWSPMKE